MSPVNEPVKKNITCREIAEAIDWLILLRIQWLGVDRVHWTTDARDKHELLLRKITDGIREHSGAKGIYVKGEND